MTEFYLILAAFLAFTLNQSSRILRVLGTLTAALALGMITWSIILANLDGTFAAIPADASLAERIKPFVLNTQAGIAATAALFLLWAVWAQAVRRVAEKLPLRNTPSVFGRVSRYAHWMVGTLILILLPMGLFTSVLAADHPERAVFMATHQALGVTVLLLVVLRLLWLGQSPPPPLPADGHNPPTHPRHRPLRRRRIPNSRPATPATAAVPGSGTDWMTTPAKLPRASEPVGASYVNVCVAASATKVAASSCGPFVVP